MRGRAEGGDAGPDVDRRVSASSFQKSPRNGGGSGLHQAPPSAESAEERRRNGWKTFDSLLFSINPSASLHTS